ncbi:flagellar hook assembly protein FlgD [Zymobacter palmae]|uniref:Basal-body rod modification protein FlgD n=1 Tax=Zymobacter palmae TaxID=33074 RepID=A0A348HFH5_9GAMM|nr:flagellar hook assembly protein FlgD [Zymobacter palmae]BBG30377.1 flagellar hook capping protein [Zymobacter palmae]
MSSVIGASSTSISTIPVNKSSSSSSSDSSTTSASTDLQQQFMTLLMAQLQNQDPTDPASNTETTAQLAQINTVSGIESLNTTLKGITSQIDSTQQLQASSLIGHGVLVNGDRIMVSSTDDGVATTPFGFNLAAAADKVTLKITNNSGEVVKSFDLGAQNAGMQSMTWDGLDESGNAVTSGNYHAVVSASSQGSAVNVSALNYAMVNGVLNTGTSGTVQLDLGTSGNATMNDVYQIY